MYSLLHSPSTEQSTELLKHELDVYFTSYDLKRLEMYSNNLVDYHLIMDLVPSLARVYFLNKMGVTKFSAVQSVKPTTSNKFSKLILMFKAILIGMGLQHKIIEDISTELELPASQLLGLFNRTIRKSVTYLTSIVEENVAQHLGSDTRKEVPTMLPTDQTVDEDLEAVAKVLIVGFGFN